MPVTLEAVVEEYTSKTMDDVHKERIISQGHTWVKYTVDHKVIYIPDDPARHSPENIWRAYVDKRSGYPYYFCAATCQTLWRLPRQVVPRQGTIFRVHRESCTEWEASHVAFLACTGASSVGTREGGACESESLHLTSQIDCPEDNTDQRLVNDQVIAEDVEPRSPITESNSKGDYEISEADPNIAPVLPSDSQLNDVCCEHKDGDTNAAALGTLTNNDAAVLFAESVQPSHPASFDFPLMAKGGACSECSVVSPNFVVWPEMENDEHRDMHGGETLSLHPPQAQMSNESAVSALQVILPVENDYATLSSEGNMPDCHFLEEPPPRLSSDSSSVFASGTPDATPTVHPCGPLSSTAFNGVLLDNSPALGLPCLRGPVLPLPPCWMNTTVSTSPVAAEQAARRSPAPDVRSPTPQELILATPRSAASSQGSPERGLLLHDANKDTSPFDDLSLTPRDVPPPLPHVHHLASYPANYTNHDESPVPQRTDRVPPTLEEILPARIDYFPEERSISVSGDLNEQGSPGCPIPSSLGDLPSARAFAALLPRAASPPALPPSPPRQSISLWTALSLATESSLGSPVAAEDLPLFPRGTPYGDLLKPRMPDLPVPRCDLPLRTPPGAHEENALRAHLGVLRRTLPPARMGCTPLSPPRLPQPGPLGAGSPVLNTLPGPLRCGLAGRGVGSPLKLSSPTLPAACNSRATKGTDVQRRAATSTGVERVAPKGAFCLSAPRYKAPTAPTERVRSPAARAALSTASPRSPSRPLSLQCGSSQENTHLSPRSPIRPVTKSVERHPPPFLHCQQSPRAPVRSTSARPDTATVASARSRSAESGHTRSRSAKTPPARPSPSFASRVDRFTPQPLAFFSHSSTGIGIRGTYTQHSF